MTVSDEDYQKLIDLYDRQIGVLPYKGNSVAWWETKAIAYRDALGRVWEALREEGIQSDGEMTAADAIRKLAVRKR